MNALYSERIARYKSDIQLINLDIANKLRYNLYTRASDELRRFENNEISAYELFSLDSAMHDACQLCCLDKLDKHTRKHTNI